MAALSCVARAGELPPAPRVERTERGRARALARCSSPRPPPPLQGNLLGGVSFREPTTVEDCDSTWQTYSEPEPEQPGPVGGGEGQEHDEPEQPEQPPKREGNAKPKRSFYAARDLYKYRHQYPNFKDIRYQNDLSNLCFYKNKIPFKPVGVYIEEVLSAKATTKSWSTTTLTSNGFFP